MRGHHRGGVDSECRVVVVQRMCPIMKPGRQDKVLTCLLGVGERKIIFSNNERTNEPRVHVGWLAGRLAGWLFFRTDNLILSIGYVPPRIVSTWRKSLIISRITTDWGRREGAGSLTLTFDLSIGREGSCSSASMLQLRAHCLWSSGTS